jgi:integrase
MPVRKRRDRDGWLLDYKDSTGQRRREQVDAKTKGEAERLLAARINEIAQPTLASDAASLTLNNLAEEWLGHVSTQLKPKTIRSYSQLFKLYVLPKLGNMRIGTIQRRHVKALLGQHREAGLSKNTVRLIRACLSAMLAEAVDDGRLALNPAALASRRGRAHADSITASDRQKAIRPLAENELAAFLKQAEADSYHVLLMTLARSGMRPGEAMALRWSDLDFVNRQILVERALSDGGVSSTKTGAIRRVDMSRELRDALTGLYVAREKETLRRGWSEIPQWVFVNSRGNLLDQSRLRKHFASVLRKAGLSGHTPYDLRHTFATLLLAKETPITYVAAQLGHAKPTTTLQWYAHWLPRSDRNYIDALDTPADFGTRPESFGTGLAPKPDSQHLEGAKALDFTGATRRIRTDDLLITNLIPLSTINPLHC